jgi:hypothetical protein
MITILIIVLFILVLALAVNYSVNKSQPKDKSELTDPNHRQIIFNVDSWHFKYYKFVTGNSKPKTLCPYFWSLVYLIPLSVIIVPFILLFKLIGYSWERSEPKEEEKLSKMSDLKQKEYFENKRKQNLRKEKIGTILGKVFVGVIIALVVLVIIIAIINTKFTPIFWKELFIVIGIIGTICLVIWLLTKLIGGFSKWVKNTSGYQIFVRGIDAWYDKSCPLIKWEEEKQELQSVEV